MLGRFSKRRERGTVLIRDFESRDRAGVIALYRAAWHAAYDAIDGAAAIERLLEALVAGDTPELFDMAPADVALVADRQGRIIGGARGHPHDGIVHLSGMYVAPDAQRSGVGWALLQTLTSRFPPATMFQADVRPASTGAIRFYERHGFVRAGVGRADAGAGHLVDMVVMRRAGREADNG